MSFVRIDGHTTINTKYISSFRVVHGPCGPAYEKGISYLVIDMTNSGIHKIKLGIQRKNGDMSTGAKRKYHRYVCALTGDKDWGKKKPPFAKHY